MGNLFFLTLISTAYGAIRSTNPTSTTAILPTAVIDAGTIIGTTTSFPSASAVVNQFLGIPFVASPTRFSIASAPTPVRAHCSVLSSHLQLYRFE